MTNEELFVNTRQLHDMVLVKILNDTEEKHDGIVFSNSPAKGTHSLIGIVISTGKECESLSVGDRVLIPKHFRFQTSTPVDLLRISEKEVAAKFED